MERERERWVRWELNATTGSQWREIKSGHELCLVRSIPDLLPCCGTFPDVLLATLPGGRFSKRCPASVQRLNVILKSDRTWSSDVNGATWQWPMQYAQWQVVINHDAQTNEQIPKKRKLHFHQHSDKQTDGITCVGVTRGLQVNCLKRLAHVQRLIYRLTAHYEISVHVWHVAQEHVQWSQSILTNRLQCLYFLDICTADWSRHFRLNYHFISLHSSYLNQRTNLLMWVPIQRSETRLTHPIFFALRTFCMQVTMTPDIVLQSTFKTHFASTFYTISGVKKKNYNISLCISVELK